MQKIMVQNALTFPWEDPLLYSTHPHHFRFQEMGFYAIYGSPVWRHTEILGRAIHHPDAALALMNMMNKPSGSMLHITS